MKKLLLSICLLMFFAPAVIGQTAVNFNCNDCAGNNHDLFTELDAGKVIVIDWVMPCGNCIGPSITASNVVQSYASSNPGQVFLYVVDDYANTNCTTINNWCTTNSITATTFSNASINMLDYNSTPGMPKIVVLGGGTSHTVYFNQLNAAASDAVALQAAIDSALATGVEQNELSDDVHLFPNPASENLVITYDATVTEQQPLQIYNGLGQPVTPSRLINTQPGTNTEQIYVGDLAAGVYFIYMGDAVNRKVMRLIVMH
jgi:Secretion system C-terminal sorting domain